MGSAPIDFVSLHVISWDPVREGDGEGVRLILRLRVSEINFKNKRSYFVTRLSSNTLLFLEPDVAGEIPGYWYEAILYWANSRVAQYEVTKGEYWEKTKGRTDSV